MAHSRSLALAAIDISFFNDTTMTHEMLLYAYYGRSYTQDYQALGCSDLYHLRRRSIAKLLRLGYPNATALGTIRPISEIQDE
jgi:hypothetical protein